MSYTVTSEGNDRSDALDGRNAKIGYLDALLSKCDEHLKTAWLKSKWNV